MSARTEQSHLQGHTWRRYRENLPRHLIGIARHMQSRTMHTLIEEHGHTRLRLHFEPYISLVGASGSQLSTISETLAISKQAVNQIVNQVERAGYLRRTPDPKDGRSKRLELTNNGHRLLRDGAKIAAGMEAELEHILGKPALARFIKSLQTIHASFAQTTDNGIQRAISLGWLLPRVSTLCMRELMELTRAKGHPSLKMSYAQVLTLMPPTGGRISAIARDQEVSKQAIGAIASELEAQGYIMRRPDATDGRQVILLLSDKGVGLIEDSVRSLDQLEGRFADIIGAKSLAELKNAAQKVYRGLELENPALGSPDLDHKDLPQLADRLLRELGPEDARKLGGLLMRRVKR